MNKIIEFLSDPIILNAISGLIGSLYSYFKIKDKLNKDWQKTLEEAVTSGVVETYQTYVRKYKEGGNKLTNEQKEIAADMALETAKKYGIEKGKDLTKKFSTLLIKSLIEQTVNKLKNENK